MIEQYSTAQFLFDSETYHNKYNKSYLNNCLFRLSITCYSPLLGRDNCNHNNGNETRDHFFNN